MRVANEVNERKGQLSQEQEEEEEQQQQQQQDLPLPGLPAEGKNI